MGRYRTTNCKKAHIRGTPCLDCARISKRRSRLRLRKLGLQDMELKNSRRIASKRAYSYVRSYLTRGAINPPLACEFCCKKTEELPNRKIFAWHPDPSIKREVIWVCEDCRRIIRKTRPVLRLTWIWPGKTQAAQARMVTPLPLHRRSPPRVRTGTIRNIRT